MELPVALVIPADALLSCDSDNIQGCVEQDAYEGIKRFIDGKKTGVGDERDGHGVKDIELVIESYTYTGG